MVDEHWPYGSEKAKKLDKRVGKVLSDMWSHPLHQEDLDLLRNMPPDMKEFLLSTVRAIQQRWIFFEEELQRIETVLKERPKLTLVQPPETPSE